MSDPILAALRRLKPARVVVVTEAGEREIALRGAGGPGGAGRWQRAAATARALAADDEGARVELRDATGHVLAAIAINDAEDNDDEDNEPRTSSMVMAPPDQRDERMLTLLVSAQRAALEEQRVILGPVLESYTLLAQGYASYAAQVVELVRVAATVRAEMDERAAAAPQAGADQALLEMLSKLPIGSGAKQ